MSHRYRSLPGCMVDLLCGVGMPGVRRGVCPDISGNGRHGTVYGRPALEFGAGEYAAAGTTWDMLGGASTCVIAADVVVVAGSGEQYLWSDLDSGYGTHLTAYLNSSEKLNVGVGPEVGGSGAYSFGTTALSAGRHSIIVLVDLQANGPTVYVDGQPYAISDWNSPPSAAVWDADTPNAQTMGDFSAGEGENWLGRVIAFGLVPGGSLDAAIAAKFHRDPTMWVAQNCASGSAEGWLVNEGSGSTLNGLNGHDLTITGADWDWTSNGAQGWINADGAGDAFTGSGLFLYGNSGDTARRYVETAASIPNGATETLVAVFAYYARQSTFTLVGINFRSFPYAGGVLYLSTTGNLTGFVGTNGDAVESPSPVPFGRHVVALVADGTDCRLYLDGVLVAGPGSITAFTPGGYSMKINRTFWTSNNCAPVVIERASVYNRALTTGELNRIAKQHGVGG